MRQESWHILHVEDVLFGKPGNFEESFCSLQEEFLGKLVFIDEVTLAEHVQAESIETDLPDRKLKGKNRRLQGEPDILRKHAACRGLSKKCLGDIQETDGFSLHANMPSGKSIPSLRTP